MVSHLLYSANPYMKFYINENYRGGIHYIWFSENFDSGTLGTYVPGAMVPPTSNPKDIYMDLKKAVDKPDTHNAKIKEQIAGLTALAVKWEKAGEITTIQKDDIIFMVNEPRYFQYWRPLLYVVPKALVQSRIKPVPMALCAGLGNEYIVEDLRGDEFGVIEL
jgi:hypothetical protein